MKIVNRLDCGDGAVKYLLECGDGERVESVFFRMDDARDKDAVCISSQIGCTLSCTFCVTGTLKFRRSLTAEEIAAQVDAVFAEEAFVPTRAFEVAYMGMGEPLFNTDAVLEAKKIIGSRHPGIGFALSTVGIVPEIERLLAEAPDVKLQISLHSPDDESRTQIMAINRKYPIADILDVAGRYAEVTGRRTNINYILIDGVNDTEHHARALADILTPDYFQVQLVPANPDPRLTIAPSDPGKILRFARALLRAGLTVDYSTQLGSEDGAGCGQLDADYESKIRTPSMGRRKSLPIAGV